MTAESISNVLLMITALSVAVVTGACSGALYAAWIALRHARRRQAGSEPR